MAYGATHVILTLVAVSLYRDYLSKWKFSLKYVLVGGIAGLMPDIDIPISWLWSFLSGTEVWFHRGFTHTFFIPIVLLLLGLLCWKWWKKEGGLFFFVCTFGWVFHIFLDIIFGGVSAPFWPLLAGGFVVFQELYPGWVSTMDAFILLLWLIHGQWKGKIKDYI